MWVVFVVAAAAVLFAVAALAAGRGDGLAAAPPDRRPLVLPEGSLSADELAGVRLAVGLRGYRMDQVDALLERVGAEVARRDERIARLEAALDHAVAATVTADEPQEGDG